MRIEEMNNEMLMEEENNNEETENMVLPIETGPNFGREGENEDELYNNFIDGDNNVLFKEKEMEFIDS